MGIKLIIMVAAVVLAACQVGQVVPLPPGASVSAPAAGTVAPSRLPATAAVASPSRPQPIAAGPDASVVKLTKIVVGFSPEERIGDVRSGADCGRPIPLLWKGKLPALTEAEVVQAFNRELKKANYPITDDPDALFSDSDNEPEFLLAGRITSLTLNYCVASKEQASGTNSVTVEWQLFDLLSRRTVYKVATIGLSRIDTPVASVERKLFSEAISDATRALLADTKFHGFASGKREAPAETRVDPVFRLYPRPNFTGLATRNMAEIQAATVTVLLPGGHGSGFFISSEGYLLTNAHVVGDAKFVRVRLASGREIAGETLLVNRMRDVALVKVSERGFTAFPIAATEPQIGSDIYAVGAPLDPNYATTVTRGVVSAYRLNEKGRRMIQGDVMIQSGNSGGPMLDAAGNVAGISTSGLGKTSLGINFFIPILEALKDAGIELGETRANATMRVLENPVAIALQPGRQIPVPVATPESPASPVSPAPQIAAEPADRPQPVAALPPAATAAKRDGEYRTRFTATTINGQSSVDLAITVEGETIRGVGRTRGGLQCRATGEIAPDGTAWINVACSNAGSAYLSWQLAGRFVVEKDGAAYIGRLAYANLTGAQGEAVFRPQQG